jgi:hypothetical protein
MKSNPDQIRITAWLTKPTHSQVRTSGCDHMAISEAMSVSSKATCAGIQNRRREMPRDRAE